MRAAIFNDQIRDTSDMESDYDEINYAIAQKCTQHDKIFPKLEAADKLSVVVYQSNVDAGLKSVYMEPKSTSQASCPFRTKYRLFYYLE